MPYGSAFMLNFIPQAWVKNVYSLCVEGVVNRAQSCTALHIQATQPIYGSVKPQLLTNYSDSFTPQLYTTISRYLHLLVNQFYTVSTAPIIIRTKKK